MAKWLTRPLLLLLITEFVSKFLQSLTSTTHLVGCCRTWCILGSLNSFFIFYRLSKKGKCYFIEWSGDPLTTLDIPMVDSPKYMYNYNYYSESMFECATIFFIFIDLTCNETQQWNYLAIRTWKQTKKSKTHFGAQN